MNTLRNIFGFVMVTASIVITGCTGGRNKPSEADGHKVTDTLVTGKAFVSDPESGQVKEQSVEFRFSGRVVDGMPEEGTATYPNGDVYKGKLANVAREDSFATLALHNGDRYEGSFYNNMYKEGTYTLKTGEQFKGTFSNNRPYNGTWSDTRGRTSIEVVNGINHTKQ